MSREPEAAFEMQKLSLLSTVSERLLPSPDFMRELELTDTGIGFPFAEWWALTRYSPF